MHTLRKKDFEKNFLFAVDDGGEQAIFAIPHDAGPETSGWFSQILGLQIGTQFCPGMMNGNVNYRRRQD